MTLEQLKKKRQEQEQQKKYPPCNDCVDEAGVDVRTCELRAIINGKAVCRS